MRSFIGRRLIAIPFLIVGLHVWGTALCGQGVASVSFTGQRAFVTGFTPIIGPNGGVGGVDVDADGVLRRVETVADGQLVRVRKQASEAISQDLKRSSPFRKVSLARLEAAIAQRIAANEALGADILFLAGLQRVECVFVYPESQEIVIAGPAGGWQFHHDQAVGIVSNHAVLRLDDLIDALQATAAAVAGNGITCSIDPTAEGMARLQQTLASRNLQPTKESLRAIEQQLGDQNVTVTGIRPTSHFARVLVGADYMMKRIAMDLDQSSVDDLPSYLRMLQQRGKISQLTSPRWWLATEYESVQRSEDGLAWRFSGRAVRANSEHGYLNQRGQLVNTGRPSPLAKRWADRFTDHYNSLAKEIPIFSQLSGCVDLAVLAALIRQEDLLRRADCPLLWLTDPGKLTGETFAVPQTVPSQARALQGRGGWIVSVSGGIDLDTSSVLRKVQVNEQLGSARTEASDRSANWWWD